MTIHFFPFFVILLQDCGNEPLLFKENLKYPCYSMEGAKGFQHEVRV